LLFLNSGDYLVRSTLFKDLFELDIRADIISGNVLKYEIMGNTEPLRRMKKPSLHKLCVHSLPHQATLIKRELFKEIGFYNESFRIISDFDFFLKAIIIFKKSYQKVDIDFSYFNLKGISSNLDNSPLAKSESLICINNNFPDMADDLIEYRYFYISNIGQLIRMLREKEKLYSFIK